jgi:hypothetical protein
MIMVTKMLQIIRRRKISHLLIRNLLLLNEPQNEEPSQTISPDSHDTYDSTLHVEVIPVLNDTSAVTIV